MSESPDSSRRGARGFIDATAMGLYIEALRKGANVAQAARAAGFSRSAFHRLRRRNGEFAAMCDEAIERSCGPRFISGGNRRRLQLRRNRHVRFTDRRKAIFLDRLAGTCNLAEAAQEAGVCEDTVFSHRIKDPGFAADLQATLDQGYVRLEAEAMRQRLEAQRRIATGRRPTGEIAAEFDRVMQLLARWDRRNGALERRSVSRGAQRAWTFDEAIAALDRKLRHLNIPIVGEDGTDIDPPPGLLGKEDEVGTRTFSRKSTCPR